MASYGYTFNSGDGVTPTRLNAARTVSNIVNADIDNAAAIAKTKISGTAITAADTGTVTSAMIADGAIVNADINASAAIAHSKLANITSGQVLLGNASNVPTATAVTGDVTINNTGVTAIGAGVIVDADVNASAAIALSKLATGALPTAITVASANLVDGTIVNADINASAAIAHSKLANITSGQVLLGNASNVPTATAVTGDVTISNTGVTAIGSGVIVNADVSATAAIDGTKISPNFGSQNVITSGSVAAKSGSNGAELISNGSVEIYNSTSTGFIDFKTTSSEDFDCRIEQVSNGLAVQTGGNGSAQERLRVSSTGSISIGLQSDLSVNAGSNDGATIYQPGTASGIFQASNNNNSSVLLRRRSSDGAVANFYRDTTAVGSISVTTTATSYNTSSDYRLKDNAQPISGALSRLSQLNPVTFTWKSNGEQGEGFIAHELQAIVPEAVTGEKDAVDADGNPQYQGVDASKLVPMLVAAVQELSAKVAALEAAQ